MHSHSPRTCNKESLSPARRLPPLPACLGVDPARLALGALLATALGGAGVALVGLSGLALPGAMAGLGLLVVAIRLVPAAAAAAGALFDRLSPHMVLFLVPAGSGMLVRSGSLTEDWPAVVLAVLLGTPAVIAAVALVARAVFRRRALRGGGGAP
jgi:putative effector of murein hydrolase LrgA (UPF0299 family)